MKPESHDSNRPHHSHHHHPHPAKAFEGEGDATTAKQGEQQRALEQMRKRHAARRRLKRRYRLQRWGVGIAILLLLFCSILIYRAVEIAAMQGDRSWLGSLEQGNYLEAARRFSISAGKEEMGVDSIMQDFNRALPHLKRAGHILTELEVEIGIPPKLIPHFYHDPKVKVHEKQVMAALDDNPLGRMVLLALLKAGDFQKGLEVGNMQFNNIEIELGPVPALKLQYQRGT